MKMNHVAIWTKDLEGLKAFYVKYFNGKANDKYVNIEKHFESYFIKFEGGTSLEVMRSSAIIDKDHETSAVLRGYAHMAFSTGTKEKVDQLTQLLELDGYTVVSHPRTTGDGFYESCILDPDENPVEITI